MRSRSRCPTAAAPPPPTLASSTVQSGADAVTAALRKTYGQQQTILTSGMGVASTPTVKKQLLGSNAQKLGG